MRKIIFLFFLLSFTIIMSYGQATVDIFLNGTLAGQITLKANQKDGAGLSYQKKTYRNIDKLSIQIQGKSVDGGYFRKLIVMGDDEKPMMVAEETVGAVGQFVLTDNEIIKRLKKGKPITLYVEKTPANTKSKESVTKVYIGTLTREK